jgi:hypothetical protein
LPYGEVFLVNSTFVSPNKKGPNGRFLIAITIQKVRIKVPSNIDKKFNTGSNMNLFENSDTAFKTIGECMRYIPIVFFPRIFKTGNLPLMKTKRRNKVTKYKY